MALHMLYYAFHRQVRVEARHFPLKSAVTKKCLRDWPQGFLGINLRKMPGQVFRLSFRVR